MMDSNLVIQLKTRFDAMARMLPDANIEFWHARDLMVELGYVQWRNFLEVVEKAKTSCDKAGQNIADHFADVSKMVPR
jgi:DNA-damage-inducible protein D